MIQLSILEKDLLTELFNLGIGKSAHSLSGMVNQDIMLSIPDVQFENRSALADLIPKKESAFVVSQSIQGPFDAKAVLVFSEFGGREIVKQLLGSTLGDDLIAELQEEALSETGNIVLNACMGSLSESMGFSFELEIPTLNICSANQLLELSCLAVDEAILLVNINMTLETNNIKVYLVFIFNEESLIELKKSLNQHVSRLNLVS